MTDLDAAIHAANEAIEARPHREWPTTLVDTSAWGPAPDRVTVAGLWDIRPAPVPMELPAGWTTVERLKAQLADEDAAA